MADLQPNGGDDVKTRTGTNDIRSAVENANKAEDDSADDDDDAGDDDDSDDDANGDGGGNGSGSDDNADDDDSDDSDGDDDDDSDDDDADGEGKPDKKSQVDRKYGQFKGDGTDSAYISNLEKGYQNSSAEAIRLKGELDTATGRVDAIMRAAASDPELATKLNTAMNGAGGSDGGGNPDGQGGDAAANPFVRNLQAEWQDKSQKEIEAFIEANPEVATDPQIEADVKHWMSVFSNDAYERTGKLMSGGEAMSLAYKHLGLENKLGKQNLADGAKKNAAPTRQRGKAKKGGSSKPTFSSDQIAMAQAMGKDEAWLVANAK